MIDVLDNGVTAEEEQAIAAFMLRLAAAPVPDASQQSAAATWLKGQLLRRWEIGRRVQVPLDAMESIEIAASLVAAAMVLVWTLPSLLRLL